MNQGMANTILSAVVGGIVGAGVVFFAGNKVDLKNVEFENLKVGTLTIKTEAVLLEKNGDKPEVSIRDGSVLAKNVVFGKRVLAENLQGHVVLANKLLATLNHPFDTPPDKWQFFAEIGATKEGGEFIVRSVDGPALSNGEPTTRGTLFRMGFDPEQRPQMLAFNNPTRSPMEISHTLSETQKQQILNMDRAANPQQGMMPQSSLDPGSVAPIQQGGPAVAMPNSNAPRQNF